MAANIKIKKLKDFNGNGYLQGVRHAAPYRFAMATILNKKWPPKYKNPPIWA
jgi:hypothetical protein